jgi:hypothetical protein
MESAMKKTAIFASAFVLVFGPAASYAQLTCNGIPVVGSSSNNSNQAQAAIANQMTQIMVCDPHSPSPPPWSAQEWSSGGPAGGTIREFSDPARVPYGTYTVGANGRKQDNTLRGTVRYSYSGGSSTPLYMISVTGSTRGNMYFCNDATAALQYSTTWFMAAQPTACSPVS